MVKHTSQYMYDFKLFRSICMDKGRQRGGTFLSVQWLRICLPKQGVQVRSEARMHWGQNIK